jgi:hypothetical protein
MSTKYGARSLSLIARFWETICSHGCWMVPIVSEVMSISNRYWILVTSVVSVGERRTIYAIREGVPFVYSNK